MEALNRSGLIRLKDWTKFTHPIGITLGDQAETYSYKIPASQAALIFTSKGDAIGNGYFPQYIVWSGLKSPFGPIAADMFPAIIFNLSFALNTAGYIELQYTANYLHNNGNNPNNNLYVITAVVRKYTSGAYVVSFTMNGALNKVI